MDTKTLEQLWATRPVRPTHPRTVAGVCEGFGRRYQVDPTLIKVAFVVATLFGGSGILLYLAAWISLPSEKSAGRAWHAGHAPHRNGRLILFAVLAILILSSFGGNQTWSSGGLVGAALMLIGWWLLYRRQPEAAPGTGADRPDVAPAPAEGTSTLQAWVPRAASRPFAATATPGAPPADAAADPPVDTVADKPVTPENPVPQPSDDPPTVPPAWDPLGAARFAWDLPEPQPAAPLPPEPRSAIGPVTIGLAVIAAAAATSAALLGAGWFTLPRILSIALVVVAIGLVIAGLRRGGRRGGAGLVPVALALVAAVAVTGTLSVSTESLRFHGIGEREWKPLSENDIRDSYELTIGSVDLDLREVELTEDRSVRVDQGIGELMIYLPEDMRVEVTCDAGIGEEICPDGTVGGSEGDPVLRLEAETVIGKVEVIR